MDMTSVFHDALTLLRAMHSAGVLAERMGGVETRVLDMFRDVYRVAYRQPHLREVRPWCPALSSQLVWAT